MRALFVLPSLFLILLTGWSIPQTQAAAPKGWPYTSIHLELRDKLHTRKVEHGDSFDARLTRDLYKGDFLIAPEGSKVRGEVLEAQGGRRNPQHKRAELEITLTEIEVDGTWIPLHSNTLKFKTKRNYSALKVGSGMALGAFLGGFKGAAAGGLAGLGWAVLTHDKHIKLKKGTELEFSMRKGGQLKRQAKKV